MKESDSRRDGGVVVFDGAVDAGNEGLFVDGVEGAIHAPGTPPRTALKGVMTRTTHSSSSSATSRSAAPASTT